MTLLNEDLEALGVFIISYGEDEVTSHLHTVVVSRFTVDTHQAAQCALTKTTELISFQASIDIGMFVQHTLRKQQNEKTQHVL